MMLGMFWKKPEAKKRTPRFYPSVIFDANTLVLLAAHHSLDAIVVASESLMDTQFRKIFREDNVPFAFETLPRSEYPLWSWNYRESGFVRTSESGVTDAVRAQSKLACARVEALVTVMNGINATRVRLRKGTELQHTIYLSKRDEARRFLESGADEMSAFEYPYLIQYADYANIPMRQAAEDVLFKARLDDAYLAKTEYLRIKYINLIKNEQNPEKIPHITDEFKRECYTSNLT